MRNASAPEGVRVCSVDSYKQLSYVWRGMLATYAGAALADVCNRVVLENLEVLMECKVVSPMRIVDRIRLYARRSDLIKSVRGCCARMRNAVQRFNVSPVPDLTRIYTVCSRFQGRSSC